jgi:2,3-bisphosphoglycerate-independent phosphoglycerate mutase
VRLELQKADTKVEKMVDWRAARKDRRKADQLVASMAELWAETLVASWAVRSVVEMVDELAARSVDV